MTERTQWASEDWMREGQYIVPQEGMPEPEIINLYSNAEGNGDQVSSEGSEEQGAIFN